jgi:ATP-binding cassette subfamily F protein 3
MLTAHHLCKSYGIDAILEDVSFNINGNDRLGLIGPNGCGKSTLLRLLAGIEPPDSGTVTHGRPALRIGYLAQGPEVGPTATLHTMLGPLSVSGADLESEVASLAAALAASPGDDRLQARYDAALQKLSSWDGQPEAVLGPLGLAGLPLDTPVSTLSGGQKTRLMLARILLESPQLLLLDEPTNHLDLAMLEWLEGWIDDFPGAALIVSHDRAFLDNTVSRILDLNPETHTVCEYSGNYSVYLQQYLEEQERQRVAYTDQEAEIRRMRQDIARTKQQSLRVEKSTTPRQPGVRRIAKKVAKKALAREKKLERYLEDGERVEKPRPSWQMKLDFGTPEHQSRDVLVTHELSVGYPGCAPLLAGLELHLRAGERIALTGPNGSGKTTLLRTIAGTLKPLAGTLRLAPSVKLGVMTQEQEALDPALSALEQIRRVAPFNETEARHFLHFFLFSGDDPLRPARDLSYGERARLQLALLVAQGCTFLLLDEPVNHLDIPSRARFEQSLGHFKGSVLAVVHDRYFIERFASGVWLLEDGRIRKA